MRRLPDPRERPWLSVSEVADITGEGQKVIRAAVAAGQLKSIRIGRYIRLPTAALYEVLHMAADVREDESTRPSAPQAVAAEVPPSAHL